MKREDFCIDASHAYRLIDVLDRESETSKVHTDRLYEDRVGAVAINLRPEKPEKDGSFRVYMDFVRLANGLMTSMYLHTSSVESIVETEDELRIVTCNSIYIMKRTTLPDPDYLDEKELLELFISNQASYMFCRGVYYDENGIPVELKGMEHPGMFTDSFLIGLPNKYEWGSFLCRYYVGWDSIDFYSIECDRMMIHNEGKDPIALKIGSHDMGIVEPGKTRMLERKEKSIDRS